MCSISEKNENKKISCKCTFKVVQFRLSSSGCLGVLQGRHKNENTAQNSEYLLACTISKIRMPDIEYWWNLIRYLTLSRNPPASLRCRRFWYQAQSDIVYYGYRTECPTVPSWLIILPLNLHILYILDKYRLLLIYHSLVKKSRIWSFFCRCLLREDVEQTLICTAIHAVPV